MKIRAMLAALCCVVGLVFVTGCESPEKGFKEWKKAIVKGDLEKANARTFGDGKALNPFLIAALQDDAEAKKNFEKTKIISCTKNGDKATLKVKDGKGQESEIEMVKDGGKWKVNPKK